MRISYNETQQLFFSIITAMSSLYELHMSNYGTDIKYEHIYRKAHEGQCYSTCVRQNENINK